MISNTVTRGQSLANLLLVLGLVLAGCTSAATQPDEGAQRGPGRETADDGPSAAALERLKEHESCLEHVYLGPKGNLTAGCGHKLTEEERGRYELGDAVPGVLVDKWLQADAAVAWAAAKKQAEEIEEPRLLEALFAVNYQLGPFWYTEHKNTWRLLTEARWEEAAR